MFYIAVGLTLLPWQLGLLVYLTIYAPFALPLEMTALIRHWVVWGMGVSILQGVIYFIVMSKLQLENRLCYSASYMIMMNCAMLIIVSSNKPS